MSIGEAWWFVDARSEWNPGRLWEFLARQGIVYDHPDAGHVWVWNDDGSRSASSLESVDRAWGRQEEIAFQLWLNSNDAVFVTMVPGDANIRFGLAGLTLDQVEK